jgi:1-acyl-sn-glycerol-3-phosphate acyltransferase
VARLVDAARTIYLQRRRKRDLWRVVHAVAQALREGDSVAVFPEGVVSDGHELLPFHGNLLEAALRTRTPIQPVALRYAEGAGTTSAAACFTGSVSLWQSLWRIAAADSLVLHMHVLPLLVEPEPNRRVLAPRLRSDIERAIAAMGRPQ